MGGATDEFIVQFKDVPSLSCSNNSNHHVSTRIERGPFQSQGCFDTDKDLGLELGLLASKLRASVLIGEGIV